MRVIRFKVVRAGELAVAAAAILLLVVVILLIVQALSGGEAVSAPASAQAGDDSAVFYWLGSGSAALRADTAAAAERGETSMDAVAAGRGETSVETAAEKAVTAFSVSVVPREESALFGGLHGTLRAPGEVIPLPEDAPRVLIYHTHTYEAYTKEAGMEYEETEKWRTADARYSVVRVGEELTRALRELGIDAVHDRTNHELPVLATAYSRSLATLATYEDAGEEFDLCLDLHRDAYIEGMGESSVETGEGRAAKILFLVGRAENYSVRPDTDGNMRFARLMTTALNEQLPGLCKDVLTKPGRYNQHCGNDAALVEVGDNHNTLTEALNAVPYLARALAATLRSPDAGTQEWLPLSAEY